MSALSDWGNTGFVCTPCITSPLSDGARQGVTLGPHSFAHEDEVRPTLVGNSPNPQHSQTGVVSICMLECQKLRSDQFVSNLVNTYVRVTVRNHSKRTRVMHDASGNPKWNELKHIPVTVVRSRKHPFNLISIQVFSFESSDDAPHVEVGLVAFHLHDVIKHSPVEGLFDLRQGHDVVGEIRLRLSFHYGFFGYGYSPQLFDEGQGAESHVKQSLLPRVDPPHERQEKRRVTLVPKATRHPSYAPFKEQIQIGYGKDLGPHLDAQLPRELEEARFARIARAMPTLKEKVDTLNSISTRQERLLYLHGLVSSANKRVETFREVGEFSEDRAAPKRYDRFVRPLVAAHQEMVADSLQKDAITPLPQLIERM